jgi:hypothetical protein
MVHNEALRVVIRDLFDEIITEFKNEGSDLNSLAFLSSFPFAFLGGTRRSNWQDRIVAAATSPTYKAEIVAAIEAYFSNWGNGTLEQHLCHAVEDFLNYSIPRSAGLPDEAATFEELYFQFDQALFGKAGLVTIFAALENVWDNSGAVVLPEPSSLRYVSQPFTSTLDKGYFRSTAVPYLEIKKSAHPIGQGREIKNKYAFFLFEYSVELPKNVGFLTAASLLRDEVTRKFVFTVRLLNLSATYSDYRGFRTIGHLASYHMNLMNFPDDHIEGGDSFELREHTGVRIRKLFPRIVQEPFGTISVPDTKIEDAIRRTQHSMSSEARTSLKVAIDQVLDYFQILESVLPVAGSEYIALYAAALLKESGNGYYVKDPYTTYEFIKRMHKVRNDVMHGRIDDVLNAKKSGFSSNDSRDFRNMVFVLVQLHILNGKLREAAPKLTLGKEMNLESVYKVSLEEMNAMRAKKAPYSCW